MQVDILSWLKYKMFVTVLIYWELGDENMEMCKRAHIFKFGQVNL